VAYVVAAASRLTIYLLAGFVVAGCDAGAGGSGLVEAPASRLVLRPVDVPEELVQFDSAPVAGRDRPFEQGPPQGPEPTSAWASRFRQADPAVQEGLLVVESRASVFAEESSAGLDLKSHRRDLTSVPGAETLPPPGIGQEGIAVVFHQPAFPRSARFIVIAWRYRNVVASVTIQGFEGGVEAMDATELARAQQRHIQRAAR
jgi:hypothetical protein